MARCRRRRRRCLPGPRRRLPAKEGGASPCQLLGNWVNLVTVTVGDAAGAGGLLVTDLSL
eukprot:750864-Alexandrium_andersonii.AAC.1